MTNAQTSRSRRIGILPYQGLRLSNLKVDTTKPSLVKMENWSPQGAVLSPTLFNVIGDSLKQKLHNLLIRYGVDLSQFADDSAVWKSGKNVDEIIRIIQIILEAVEEWAIEWGFLISPGKTQVVLFNSFGIDPNTLKKNSNLMVRNSNTAKRPPFWV